MTPCALRLKAAGVIEQRGHTKNTLENRQGEVCLIGAFNTALTGSSDHPWATLESNWSEELVLINAAVRSMGFVDEGGKTAKECAIDWNNAPERTKAEVIARLREGCDEPQQTT